MTKTIKSLILGMLMSFTVSCQDKQQKMIVENTVNSPRFQWQESLCSPLGYPMEIYKGGLEGNGSYASLESGTTDGEWASSGAGRSYGVKTLPNRINFIWVSYAEGCFYSIDSPIDYEKMLQLFEEGYQDSGFFFNDEGEYKKCTYTTIVVGLAPGGVVVVWVKGGGRQVEIGRYQGEKYIVSEEEIAKLDNHDILKFQKEYQEKTMLNTQIVPLEVREANAGKPIPYNLWDSYRVWYSWKPIYSHKKEFEITSLYIEMFNGENEEWFDKSLLENKFTKRSIPKSAHLTWTDWTVNSWSKDKGQGYGGEIVFDEKEIIKAFEEMYKEDKDGKSELQFTVNQLNSFVTVQLRQGDKEIRLIKTKVKIVKSRNLSLKK
ncbi:DUF2931 family protein [Flavobacterium hercynium]|uniref:DUF2931 domain-containing protein n=1 Tax=Flavobacterium hercynium TaxID=387094 RepID=A0A226GMY6_9FLAO|nr:DUF2931 family protein [Flavobacterium hercynium]OXA83307.1 hypothetical protein B0A66_22385 [Flavobacterium hercynium]SMP15007.1 Protein of unknown function [Flavobacterium hercynium]